MAKAAIAAPTADVPIANLWRRGRRARESPDALWDLNIEYPFPSSDLRRGLSVIDLATALVGEVLDAIGLPRARRTGNERSEVPLVPIPTWSVDTPCSPSAAHRGATLSGLGKRQSTNEQREMNSCVITTTPSRTHTHDTDHRDAPLGADPLNGPRGLSLDLSRVVHREVTYSRVRHALRLPNPPTRTRPSRKWTRTFEMEREPLRLERRWPAMAAGRFCGAVAGTSRARSGVRPSLEACPATSVLPPRSFGYRPVTDQRFRCPSCRRCDRGT